MFVLLFHSIFGMFLTIIKSSYLFIQNSYYNIIILIIYKLLLYYNYRTIKVICFIKIIYNTLE